MKSTNIKRFLILLIICFSPTAAMAADLPGSLGETSITHRMMLLVIQLGLILFAAKLGNILFRRIKLPGALGELAAGMVIGPYLLGALGFYGFPDGLFPPPTNGQFAVSAELYAFAAVAAIVLLFHIGLETDLKLLLRYSLAGSLVGAGGMLVSFFLGAASVMIFSESLFGEKLALFAPPCLLLGTITTATSVGITARILSEKRKLDSPEGVTILSAAVIDDVLGIILLAAVMGIVTASKATGSINWGHVGIVGAKALGVWVGATVVGLIASRKISFLLKWFGEKTSIAVMALGLALILAGLFEEAGLAMIIGAYVMGLSLSKTDIAHVIREKLSPVYALLIPVFFCVTGMQINISALSSPGVLVFGFSYAFIAMASKVVGCGLPALLVNFNLRGAARIGFGMAPRCEVALIIAGVGLSVGLLNPQIFPAVIIMVIVNTVVAPPALTFLFANSKRGTRTAVAGNKAEAAVTFEMPSIEMTEFFVNKLANVFEAEGFFVHLISREQRLYQVRKDTTVIDFQHHGTKLSFASRQADVGLVNAAMYEALAALEQSVSALKQPLDTKTIRSSLQDTGPLGPQTLPIREYLTVNLIEPNLQGKDKGEIIDELLAILQQNGLIKDLDAARKAVWEREESMSTGLQYGVAIPHAKTDAVDRLICTVGIKKDGVDFDAMDGEPSRIFVLTLSPKSKPAPHVQFMSTISQILNDEGRNRILSAKNARDIYRAFTEPVLA
ncbi:MAG: cation:proton antiporter domain-containing protein [Planctomycetota bacterium]|jgi:Kef-type K+ transport system membrane component KefB/mannitol/fructose-specific phosphotransferase system IIA component (Ntr-type)